MPKTWQGVLYILIIAALLAVIQSLPIDEVVKMVLSVGWAVFVLIDVLQVMASIKLDEREQKIEAIAERNAAWTMIAAIAVSILYVSTLGKELKGIDLMPVLIFPVAAGVIAKGISNFILERRGV